MQVGYFLARQGVTSKHPFDLASIQFTNLYGNIYYLTIKKCRHTLEAIWGRTFFASFGEDKGDGKI